MSSIHYKFRSSLDYDTLTFDGPSISLKDLIDAILLQKKIGQKSDFTLEVTNAQTKEVYQDSSLMIPRNTSVVVKRVPVSRLAAVTGKVIDAEGKEEQNPKVSLAKLNQTGDLANANASEDDKISAMMQQSNEQWKPDQYVTTKGRPGEYICFRCGQKGHFIRNCPTLNDPKMNNTRFPQMRGGVTKEYYMMQMKEKQLQTSVKPSEALAKSAAFTPVVASDVIGTKAVPKELQCPMCKKLFHDAVVIPCCGTSYCDECIRNYLIDNDFACPSCKTNSSPDDLIPNKSLRQAVEKFKNTSHLPSPNTPGNNVGQPVTSNANSQQDTPATDAKPAPKIAIKLLNKKEEVVPKPSTETKKDDKESQSDALNTSVGPVTEAQLFAEIAKDSVADNAKVAEAANEKVQLTADQPNDGISLEDAKDTAEEASNTSQSGKESPQPTDATAVAQPNNQSPAVILQQQQKLALQQQQQLHMQQQMQLQQLQMQHQQRVDAQLQATSGVMPNQAQLLVQSMAPQVGAMPLTMVSGHQVMDQTRPVVASQSYPQRLAGPGIVNPGVSVLTHRLPSGLPTAVPLHPSVVARLPAGIPPHLARPGPGHMKPRGAGSFGFIDPLFDMTAASKNTGGPDLDAPMVPLTEEEFYRMKIKMKDSSSTKRSRSKSKTPSSSRHRTAHSNRSGSSSRRSRRSGNSREKGDELSRRRTEKSSRHRDDSRESSRPHESSRRKRKEQSTRSSKNEDKHSSGGKHRSSHMQSSLSRSRSHSPAKRENTKSTRRMKRIGEGSTKRGSPSNRSRSPSPARKTKSAKRHRESSDFKTIEVGSDVDSEEFKTVKLEGSISKQGKSLKSKKVDGTKRRQAKEHEAVESEAGSKSESGKKAKKRKSDDQTEQKQSNKAKKEDVVNSAEGKKMKTKEKKVKAYSTSQESSQLSDSSTNKIRVKKTKKIVQKRKTVQAMKKERAKDVNKESIVEIKTLKPLVDFSTSQSESDVEAKRREAAQQNEAVHQNEAAHQNEASALNEEKDDSQTVDISVANNGVVNENLSTVQQTLLPDVANEIVMKDNSILVGSVQSLAQDITPVSNQGNDNISMSFAEGEEESFVKGQGDLDCATADVVASNLHQSVAVDAVTVPADGATTDAANDTETDSLMKSIDEVLGDSKDDVAVVKETSLEVDILSASADVVLDRKMDVGTDDVLRATDEKDDVHADVTPNVVLSSPGDATSQVDSAEVAITIGDLKDESNAEHSSSVFLESGPLRGISEAVGNGNSGSLKTSEDDVECVAGDKEDRAESKVEVDTAGNSVFEDLEKVDDVVVKDFDDKSKETVITVEGDVQGEEDNESEGEEVSSEEEGNDDDASEEDGSGSSGVEEDVAVEDDGSEDQSGSNAESEEDHERLVDEDEESEDGEESNEEIQEEDDEVEEAGEVVNENDVSDDEIEEEEEGTEEEGTEEEDDDGEEEEADKEPQESSNSGSDEEESSGVADEENMSKMSSDEVSEEEVKKQRKRSSSSRTPVNGHVSSDDSDEDSEEDVREKKRKEKKHKKESRKMKRKRKHAGEDEESDDEEPRKKRRRKSEKKSKKHKKKHKKHNKKHRKHRKSKKYEDDNSDSESEDERRSSKSRKMREDRESQKRLKSRNGDSKRRRFEYDSDNDESNIVVEVGKSRDNKYHKSRRIYLKSSDDDRYYKSKRSSKTIRTVTGKRK